MKNIKIDKKTLTTVVCISIAFVLVFAAITAVLYFFLNGKEPEDQNGSEDRPSIENISGVWIASVSNIDFPSRPDLTKAELEAEIDSIVETVSSAGLNTIFFQVRPSSDALYDSEIFPVSRYLSTGGKLETDPLEYMISKASEKGISVHAWVNPLRASVGRSVDELDDMNPAKKNPHWTVEYSDGKLYYNCGIPEVREMIAKGLSEIVENYDVDGVVFDDYFYPYPNYETDDEGNRVLSAFEDSTTFNEYGEAFDEIGDWRRENVNSLIKLCYDTVKNADKDCLFGVSPFGIWKNGYGDASGSETRGSQSYFDIYCDTLAWVEGGYVDYIAPQLYWTADNSAASYTVLTKWWSDMLRDSGVPLLISHAAYRYEEWESPQGIMTSQVENAAQYEEYKGSIYYGYEEIANNAFGITDELKALYKKGE